MKSLGYGLQDFIPSELSGNRAVDLHHIVNREDRIENLMALTRDEHAKHGEIKSEMYWLLMNHKNFLDMNGVKYDYEWFEKYMNQYAHYND